MERTAFHLKRQVNNFYAAVEEIADRQRHCLYMWSFNEEHILRLASVELWGNICLLEKQQRRSECFYFSPMNYVKLAVKWRDHSS